MRNSLNLAGSVFTVLLLALQSARCSEALDMARAAGDWPSVAEISRRELDKSPDDIPLWQARIGALIELDEKERAARELDAWEASAKPRPAVIDGLRGDLAEKPEDALKFWKAFAKAEPRNVATLDKIIAKETELARWADAGQSLTQRIGVESSAALLTRRAVARLRLARYADAFADIRNANKADATDSEVKEWLPRFERIEINLKRLRELAKKIESKPNDPALLVERALFFGSVNCNDIALPDLERAHQIAPESRAILLHCAGVLKQVKGADAVEKLARIRVPALPLANADIVRLANADERVAAKPGDAAALAARAAILNGCNQWGLAFDDAEAALKINPDHAAALVESGRALAGLEKPGEAVAQFERASRVEPGNFYAWLWLGEMAGRRAEHAAAVDFASRSLAIRETPAALLIRERSLRALGRNAEADRDALKLSGTKK